jgi:hypothetical protein
MTSCERFSPARVLRAASFSMLGRMARNGHFNEDELLANAAALREGLDQAHAAAPAILASADLDGLRKAFELTLSFADELAEAFMQLGQAYFANDPDMLERLNEAFKRD